MCYTVPTAAAVITTFCWKKSGSTKTLWLMLMLYGSALFGIIDHLWNGELFLISENWRSDIALGAVITAAIFAAWGTVIVLLAGSAPQKQGLDAGGMRQ